MPTSEIATTKRSVDVEASSTSHEYSICLLGDWAHVKPSNTNPPTVGTSAVHEISVEFDSPVVQVSCGSGWSCLLCEDGRAFSFGDNTYGQLGQGHDRPYVPVPVPMSTPFSLLPRRRIIRLSCGSVHGGFVLDVGELYMFGCGSYGRLGTGNEDNLCIPIKIPMKWSSLLAAAPGVSSNRKSNSSRNIVINEEEDEVKFTDISCGDRHTLALSIRIIRGNSDIRTTTTKSKTGIISFGDGMNGRLGLGDEKDRYEGALLATWLAASNAPGVGIIGNSGRMAPPTITAICAGTTHNLALSASGDVFSWGNGVDGQLGHGTTVSEWVPRQLEFFKNLSINSISCGDSHSVAVSRTGVVYTWGRGVYGQLGLDLEDSNENVLVPRPVTILKGSTHRVTVRSIVAKHNISLALDDRDRLFIWGDNAQEQLGFPLSANTEVGTTSFLPKPRMRSYMDLHAPKSTTGNPQMLSRTTSVRELVAAAKPDPIRIGLTHLEAGDRFTMLLFTTKPGISSGNISSEIREVNSRMPPEISPEIMATGSSKWSLSLAGDLPGTDVPSRETAYYRFMVNYKVYIRPKIKSRDDSDEEAERDFQRRSPRRRERKRSTVTKKGNIPTATVASTPEKFINATGIDKNVQKTGNSSTNSSPFQPKEAEIRSVSSVFIADDARIRAFSLPIKPHRPSGLGRMLSVRRPTAPPSKNNPPKL